MTTLRIAIESGAAVTQVERLREQLRQLGGQAATTDESLRRVGKDIAPAADPFASVRDSIAAVRREAEALRDVQPFGAGLDVQPFGAGLFAGTTFSSSQVQGVRDSLRAAAGDVGDLAGEVGKVGESARGSFGEASGLAQKLGTDASAAAAQARAALAALGTGGLGPGLAASTIVDAAAINAASDAAFTAQRVGFQNAAKAAQSYEAAATRSFTVADLFANQHAKTLLSFAGIYSTFQVSKAFISGAREIDDATRKLGGAAKISGDELDELRDRIARIGDEVPISTAALLQLGAAAPKLGARDAESIESFVRQAGTLQATVPGIASSIGELGNKLGAFLRLTGDGAQDVGKINDVIKTLDGTVNASGAEIFNFGLIVAREGAGFVKTSTEALALGAAIANLGENSSAAQGAVATIFTTIRNAANEGGKALASIERLTGLTRDQLRSGLQTEPLELFIRTLEGVASAGTNASFELGELGISGARQATQLGALIQNAGSLRGILDLAARAAENGGKAQADLEKQTSSLSGQIALLGNTFGQLEAKTTGVQTALAGVVGFTREVVVEMFGLAQGTDEASTSVQALVIGLEATAATAGAFFVIGRASAIFQAVSAAITTTNTSLLAFQISGVAATTTATGMAAALLRARAAMVAFATSPAGIALSLGAAVAAFVALNRAADDFDTSGAIRQLEELDQRLARLDRAAAGLAEARDIVFRASISGDADQKIVGLRQRLRELQEASNVVTGSLRSAVEPVQREIQKAVADSAGDGTTAKEITERTQAILEAGFRLVEAPSLPPDQAKKVVDEFYASVAAAGVSPKLGESIRQNLSTSLSQVSLPTGTVQALKIDDLVPNIDTATGLLENAIDQAFSRARDVATKDAERYRREVAAATRFNPSEFAAVGVKLPTPFSDEFRTRVLSEIGGLFGPEVQAQAQASLDLAVRGLDIPGFSPGQSRQFRDSLDAIFAAATGRQVSDEGIVALRKSLEATGVTADEAKTQVDDALSSLRDSGATEGVSRVAASVFQQFRVGSVTAIVAQRALNAEIGNTGEALQRAIAEQRPQSADRPSEFFKDEAQRIAEATRSAELSIGQLTTTRLKSQAPSSTVASGAVLYGVQAEIAAVKITQDEYEKLVVEKRANREITEQEASALLTLSRIYAEAQVDVIQYRESQRRLGQEQEFLGKAQGLLGQELEILGLRARGETAQAFEILRQQIEATRAAAEKEIDLRVLEPGTTEEDVRRLKAFADQQKANSLRALELRKSLAENRREIEVLTTAATSFGSNATDAILGLTKPLDALRNILIDIARQFLEPQLTSLFVKGTTSGETQAAVAQGAGVEDLVLKDGQKAATETAATDATAGLAAAASSTTGAFGVLVTATEAAVSALLRVAGLQPLSPPAVAPPALGGSSVAPPPVPGAGGGTGGSLPLLVPPGAGGGAGPLPIVGPVAGRGAAPLGPLGPIQPAPSVGVRIPFLDTAATDQGAEPLAQAGAAAAAGLSEVAQAGATAASSGLAPIAQAAEVAGGGFGAVQSSAVELVGGFTAAAAAANEFAAAALAASGQQTAATVASVGGGALGRVYPFASGGVVDGALRVAAFASGGEVSLAPRPIGLSAFELGGVPGGSPVPSASSASDTGRAASVASFAFGGGVAQARQASQIPGLTSALARSGPLPSVQSLEGSVIGRPTLALIGEGADREAVMPLDGSGGVRGVSGSGRSLSLPLARDSSGKLGVRVDLGIGALERFALGGVPGRRSSDALSGARSSSFVAGPAAGSAGFPARVIETRNDNRSIRSVTYNSTVNVTGGASPLDSGMRYSLRQYQADVLSLKHRT